MRSCDVLLTNLAEVATCAGAAPRVGRALDDAGVIERGAVAIGGAKIVAVGPEAAIRADWRAASEVDCGGGTLVPGFVDAHTHPVFAATREREFDLRVRGKSYQEITAAGGGIFSSVRSLRATDDATLERRLRARCDNFLAHGTTTVEAKSGYGLSAEDELRSLEVLARVAASHPLEVHPTFLGAHQVPAEWKADRAGYFDLLIDRVLPQVVARRLATACDVFCDEGAITVDESRRLLVAALRAGLRLRVHADELARIGASELAGELRADSADHLCKVDDAGIAALVRGGTCGVLLPGTVLSLGLKALPPARKLVDSGVPVVIATDFNPGTSYLQSMPVAIQLACSILRLTVAEALVAATANAAHSLRVADRVGSIEAGKDADLVLLDRASHLFLGYELGENPVRTVWKRGAVVYRRSDPPAREAPAGGPARPAREERS